MNTLKKAAAVLFLVASFMMASSLAQAASGTATVSYVGQNTSVCYLVLIPTGGVATLYVLPSAQANSMMAVALTALSAGKTITFDDGGSGVIQNMYINNS